jgi:dTDP-4-amino-4,6-dideoxygalactose transaminase
MTNTNASPILLNDFKRQWADTSDAVLSAVRDVGESGWYILGKQVSEFERALATSTARKHAIGCANGLDAIEIGLRALGVKPGSKVLTTPLSAYATTLAITRAEAVPVFVDTDATGLIDLALVERELSRDPTIKHMVPVHLFGQALELDRLEAIKNRFEVKIVEDCAQAVCARSGGRMVGSVGEVSATSFYPTKNLGALGDGGAMFTDDATLDRALRVLRDYGQSTKYVHDVAGLNSRLDELHAAVLLRAFLPRLPAWIERRRAVAAHYDSALKHPKVKPLPTPPGSQSVWHLYPVTVPAAARESFMKHLSGLGVGNAIHYPQLISDQKALAGVPFEVRGELKHAAQLAAEEVSLPIHPYLTDAEVARVVDAVNSWPAP